MSSGASPTTVSSVVEPLEKSEFISPGISVESTSVINTTKSQHSDSAWRRRVHSQYNIVKVCTQSISTIPERVCCFDKPVAAESLHNNKDVLLWLFTQNNVQLYDLENSECQRIIQLPYSDISFVKPFYSSCKNIQAPLQIRGIMAIGLKNGDCILYDGYTGTYLQTLSPPATVSNNLSVSTISCSCPIVYSDCYLKEPTPVDWLLIGYGDSQFAQWQLDWKTDVPCSNVAAYKEWTISNTSHLKDAYYLSHLQLWIVLSNRAAFVMDPQGSVIYHYSTEWESFQLLIMECIFLLEQMERKILMLIISEEGMLQYCKMEYLSGSIRLEPLETSFLSFNDCTNICSCCHLCCNYFLLGSYDGGLSLFQWNQNSLGYIIPVCLYKKVVHSDKFHFVSCKREKENFTIRTYCPEENQLVTLSLVVKHKPECHSFITNDVQNTSSVIKREEKSHVSPSEQNMERRDIHYGNTVALSNSKERTSEMSTVSNEIGQTPFMAYRSNETTGLDVPYNSKSMLSETEQRLQLLQIEYEQERKIHQKLREELLNRALEAEEQVERLEAKLKQVQRMKRHPRESSKEDECSSPSIGTQDSDGKDKIALLEKQLREVSEAKQLLMTQAKEDIDYLQNRVEALDTVLLSSQQDLEDFISMTVEMNEYVTHCMKIL